MIISWKSVAEGEGIQIKKIRLGINPAFYPYNGCGPNRMRDIIRDLFTA